MKSQSYKTILNSHRCRFNLIGINKAGPYVYMDQPNGLKKLRYCGQYLFLRHKI